MNAKAKHKRQSWDEYFSGLVEVIGSRGSCDRGRAGALLAVDNRIIATGYVGAPSGAPHCDEVSHDLQQIQHEDGTKSEHCVRTTHAEQNAIAQSAKFGLAINGATLYVRMTPCYTCAKMLINSGIKRVVALSDYHVASKSKALFKSSGVAFTLSDAAVLKYEK